MQIIFESILPIFLIVASGIVLKRLPLFDKGLWNGLEQLGFYVLFPCYLFVTLATADYSDIDILPVSAVYLGAVLLMAALLMAAGPLFRAAPLRCCDRVSPTRRRCCSYCTLSL